MEKGEAMKEVWVLLRLLDILGRSCQSLGSLRPFLGSLPQASLNLMGAGDS